MVWSPGTGPAGTNETKEPSTCASSARHRTTKLLFAAVVSSVVFAGVYGFAASLGLTTSGLGAGSAVVAACGTGTNAAYSTTYSASIPGYSVSQVNLSAIPAACLSKSYNIQLTGAAGARSVPRCPARCPPRAPPRRSPRRETLTRASSPASRSSSPRAGVWRTGGTASGAPAGAPLRPISGR